CARGLCGAVDVHCERARQRAWRGSDGYASRLRSGLRGRRSRRQGRARDVRRRRTRRALGALDFWCESGAKRAGWTCVGERARKGPVPRRQRSLPHRNGVARLARAARKRRHGEKRNDPQSRRRSAADRSRARGAGRRALRLRNAGRARRTLRRRLAGRRCAARGRPHQCCPHSRSYCLRRRAVRRGRRVARGCTSIHDSFRRRNVAARSDPLGTARPRARAGSRRGGRMTVLASVPLWLVVLVKSAILLLVVVTTFAYAMLAERKVLGWMQLRPGPNRVGPWGLLQPAVDAVKLILKEDLTHETADPLLYKLAPFISLVTAFSVYAVIPFGASSSGVPWVVGNVNAGILFILAITSLGVYGICLGGWASGSKYPLLGSVRS